MADHGLRKYNSSYKSTEKVFKLNNLFFFLLKLFQESLTQGYLIQIFSISEDASMLDDKRLSAHLENRPAQLKEAQKNGTKIIGYLPGGYVPEELIHACGAVPVCLIKGGSLSVSDAALSVVPHIICPFTRAQIGERMLKNDPYYSRLDMLIAPITCQHFKKLIDLWEYKGEIEMFKLGVPHQYESDFSLDYFTGRLRMMKDRLQEFTGNEITDQKLSESIDLYNKMRRLLKQISLLRSKPDSPVSGLDFIKLNHASFYADPAFMVDYLESYYDQIKDQHDPNSVAPRLMISGPNISSGDYRVPELIEASGAKIIVEEVCEGIRYCWNEIENNGDLFKSLAKAYLADRVPCAFMKDSAGKRLDFTLKLIKDFNVSGLVWYELLNCETYDSESCYFERELGEKGIPMLTLESDYSSADTGQIKTRIEAFIEILKGELA